MNVIINNTHNGIATLPLIVCTNANIKAHNIIKTDNNLSLLKCELEDAGHGGKSGRDSAIEEIAFDFSFILKIAKKLNT